MPGVATRILSIVSSVEKATRFSALRVAVQKAQAVQRFTLRESLMREWRVSESPSRACTIFGTEKSLTRRYFTSVRCFGAEKSLTRQYFTSVPKKVLKKAFRANALRKKPFAPMLYSSF